MKLQHTGNVPQNNAPEALYQLVYSSHAMLPNTESARAQAVDNLITKAKKHNLERNLTGVLMLQSGRFTHVLEGELSDIERTYERIAVDSKHRDIVILDVRQIPQRSFPGRPLAFLQRQTNSADQDGSDDFGLTDDANKIVALLKDSLATQPEPASARSTF